MTKIVPSYCSLHYHKANSGGMVFKKKEVLLAEMEVFNRMSHLINGWTKTGLAFYKFLELVEKDGLLSKRAQEEAIEEMNDYLQISQGEDSLVCKFMQESVSKYREKVEPEKIRERAFASPSHSDSLLI